MTLVEPEVDRERLNSFSYASPQMTSRYEHRADSEAPPASLKTCKALLPTIVGINRRCHYCLAGCFWSQKEGPPLGQDLQGNAESLLCVNTACSLSKMGIQAKVYSSC